jgi:hypothetical protein
MKLYVEVLHKTSLRKPEFHENRRNLSLLMYVNEFVSALSADCRDMLREKYPKCAAENLCVRIVALKGIVYLGA